MVPAEVATTGTPSRAAGDTEAAVFRVAQEALSNVAKHAHASKVHLTLTYLDDSLILEAAPGHGTTLNATVPLCPRP